MTADQTVSLDAATAADATLLASLLEQYAHDLSGIFPELALGLDGRFSYPPLPRYWSEPDRRWAFLIRCEGQVAGFVLAKRGSPAAPDDPDALDIAEFFVLRQHRRAGVGRRAALLLWNKLPGKWTVRVPERHLNGVAFWQRVVTAAAIGGLTESRQTAGTTDWRVYTFNVT